MSAAENDAGLPESRCGLANSPGHRPHPMTVTGEWPKAGPHRWCVGYVTAIDRYARELADATFRLKRSLHTEGDQRRADRAWAALQIERAGLDVCRALGEA